MNINKLQSKAFQIIAITSAAKTLALSAFQDYKVTHNKNKLKTQLKAAEQKLGEVGRIHMDVLQAEAKGVIHPFSAMFMHAEDTFITVQMMIEMMQVMS